MRHVHPVELYAFGGLSNRADSGGTLKAGTSTSGSGRLRFDDADRRILQLFHRQNPDNERRAGGQDAEKRNHRAARENTIGQSKTFTDLRNLPISVLDILIHILGQAMKSDKRPVEVEDWNEPKTDRLARSRPGRAVLDDAPELMYHDEEEHHGEHYASDADQNE